MLRKGCKANNIIAAIGPCIQEKNYNVKENFMKKFIKKYRYSKSFFKKKKKKLYFNLPNFVKSQLKSNKMMLIQ